MKKILSLILHTKKKLTVTGVGDGGVGGGGGQQMLPEDVVIGGGEGGLGGGGYQAEVHGGSDCGGGDDLPAPLASSWDEGNRFYLDINNK